MIVAGHELRIRIGTPADLAWIDDFRKKHRDLGFIPRHAMALYIASSRVTIADVDGDQVAYIVHNSKRNRTIHLAQLAVLPELWRNGIGGEMLAAIAREGEATCCTGITAKPSRGLVVEHALASRGFTSIGSSRTRAAVLGAWWLELSAGRGRSPMVPPQSNKSRYNAPWTMTVPRVRLQGPYSVTKVENAIVIRE